MSAQKSKFAAPFKTPPASKINTFFSQQSTPGIDVSSLVGISAPDSQIEAEEPEPQSSCSTQDLPLKRTFSFKTPKQRPGTGGEGEDSSDAKLKSPLVVKWPGASWPHKDGKNPKSKPTGKSGQDKAKNGPKHQNGSSANEKSAKKALVKSVRDGQEVKDAKTTRALKGKKVKEQQEEVCEKLPQSAKKPTKRKANENNEKTSKKQPANKQERKAAQSKKRKTVVDGKDAKKKAETNEVVDIPEKNVSESPHEADKEEGSSAYIDGNEMAVLPSAILESQGSIFPVATQPPPSPGIPSYQVPQTSTPKRLSTPRTPGTPRTPFKERMAMKSPAINHLAQKGEKSHSAKKAKKAEPESKALKKSMNRSFPQGNEIVLEFNASPYVVRAKKGKGGKKRAKSRQKLAEEELRKVMEKMQAEILVFRQRRQRLHQDSSMDQESIVSMIQPLNL